MKPLQRLDYILGFNNINISFFKKINYYFLSINNSRIAIIKINSLLISYF